MTTKHFNERYVQRIIGIEDENEAKQYAVENQEMIENYAQKMFERAQLVYTGTIGKNDKEQNFYISDDMVIVASIDNTCLITMYRVKFNFPAETNKVVIKDLIEEIRELQDHKDSLNDANKIELVQLEQDKERIEAEISILKDQIKILEDSRELMNNKIREVNNNVRNIDSEIKIYAHQLLNWRDYYESA